MPRLLLPLPLLTRRAISSAPRTNDQDEKPVSGEEGFMSEGYSIEIAEELVGIIVRAADEQVFRFHSAVKEYRALDGHSFAHPEIAERALRDYAKRKRLAVR